MLRRSWLTVFLVACLLCGTVSWSLAAGITSATDKNPKPDDPSFTYTRTPFNCAGRDTLVLFPDFYTEIPDSTTASENNLPGYACRSWNEQGPENIYRLEVGESLELFASLRAFQDIDAWPGDDLDIFLLNDCDTDSCLVGENLEFSILLDPGTYYLVVDGFGDSSPAQGFYTLLIECRFLGVPPQICDPGGSIPINPGAEIIPHDDNLFDQPNLIQTYDCSSIIERGGEVWFAVTVDPHHEFDVTTTLVAGELDMALWLFDGCGPQAQCLGFADNTLAGGVETLTLANDTDLAVTVFLGCDSYRRALSEDLGAFSLEFAGTSNVPTVKRSVGSVRSLYR